MDLIKQMKEAYGKRLLVGGHRGHKCEIRENTISNFEALPLGKIPYIEIDVQLTKDGHAVIYHDHDLSMKTHLTGMIRDYTLEELKASFEICTIYEAVEWCKAHRLGIAFEIKLQPYTMWNDRGRVIEEIINVIRTYDFYENCFVFGKDYEMLAEIKNQEPRIYLGLIVPFVPKDPVALMKEMQAIIYLNFVDQFSKELVDQLHEAGYLVDGSVVNTEKDLKKALELGVDLIESDEPELITRLLEEWYAG